MLDPPLFGKQRLNDPLLLSRLAANVLSGAIPLFLIYLLIFQFHTFLFWFPFYSEFFFLASSVPYFLNGWFHFEADEAHSLCIERFTVNNSKHISIDFPLLDVSHQSCLSYNTQLLPT